MPDHSSSLRTFRSGASCIFGGEQTAHPGTAGSQEVGVRIGRVSSDDDRDTDSG